MSKSDKKQSETIKKWDDTAVRLENDSPGTAAYFREVAVRERVARAEKILANKGK